MSLKQMLPGQKSLWQLTPVKDTPPINNSPRNLPVKFGQYNSWVIADMDKCPQNKYWLENVTVTVDKSTEPNLFLGD